MKRVALFMAVCLSFPLFAQRQQQASEREFTHTLLVTGVAASAPVRVPLRSTICAGTLRNFAVGQGTAKDVPNASFSVMELQSGHVFTTIGGDRQERVPGDFWTVPKGTAVTFENPHPHAAAIVRVTSFESNP